MAKNYGNIDSKALLTFDKTFARANGQPLDKSSVWYTLTDAENYAKTAEAYVGQIITVIQSNTVTHYTITDTAGSLEEIGGDNGGSTEIIKLEWGSF